jgi:hypothetical protein
VRVVHRVLELVLEEVERGLDLLPAVGLGLVAEPDAPRHSQRRKTRRGCVGLTDALVDGVLRRNLGVEALAGVVGLSTG